MRENTQRPGDSDVTLVRRCLKGDKAAFVALLDRYEGVVYSVAFNVCHNRQDAEDVAQTVFMKVYEHLDRFDSNHRFFSWIYRVSVNEAINLVKKRRGHQELDSGIRPAGETAGVAPDDRIRDDEDEVLQALGWLSPDDRAIVILKHLEGFSYRDIAYILDLEEKTVKSRLYTARQRLKDVLTANRATPGPRATA